MTRYVWALALLLLQFAIISGCGGGSVGGGTGPQVDPTPGPTPAPCDSKGTKVGLALFAARDCGPCIKELPDLNNRIQSQLADKACRVNAVVYLTDAELTQDQANEWGQKLGLKFTMALDPRCRNTYKKYYGGGCTNPAGVILTEAGETVKKYKPGAEGVLDDMMAIIKQELGK